MKPVQILCLLLSFIAPAALALEQKEGSPLDHLPSYIRKINDWGQRADFSLDSKKILFIEKTFGDVFEMDLATGVTRPLTHHYYHGGYTRALYLANGDILLSGCTDFDAEDPQVNRWPKAELWVLDKALTNAPVRLNMPCFEGPCVSRKHMRIAWTSEYRGNPDYAPRELRIHCGDIVYDKGIPKLVNTKTVLSNVTHPYFEKPVYIETQNFIADEKNKITMTLYQIGAVSIVDLETGDINVVSTPAKQHNEAEGIFPDGKHTLVESSRQFQGKEPGKPIQHIDIWKLSLDGKETWERITHFTDYKGFKTSNPVVSDDGKYICFQMAKLGDPAGVGRGLFLLDIQAMEEAKK